MRNFRKRTWTAAFRPAACATFLAVLAVASAKPDISAAEDVKVGMNRNAADLPYFIAQEMGFFQDEGLTVELTAFRSATEMVVPLGTGQLDVGGGAATAALYNAIGRGVVLKIVADKASTRGVYSPLMILVQKDLVESGAIKTIADFKGRKFGNISPGGGGESLVNLLMQKTGLAFADVDSVYMPPPQLTAAFENKALDATLMTEPFSSVLIKRGAAVLWAPAADIYPNMQVAVIFFGKSMLEKRDIGQKFMNAYIRAARVYNDALADGKFAGPGGERLIEILAKYTGQKDLSLIRDSVPGGLSPDGKLTMESLQLDFDFFKKRGLIESNIHVEDAVDSSFADKSVQILGPYKPKGG